MISLNGNDQEVINLLFVLPFKIYLKLTKKYCNFETENSRSAWHYVVPAQEVNVKYRKKERDEATSSELAWPRDLDAG